MRQEGALSGLCESADVGAYKQLLEQGGRGERKYFPAGMQRFPAGQQGGFGAEAVVVQGTLGMI